MDNKKFRADDQEINSRKVILLSSSSSSSSSTTIISTSSSSSIVQPDYEEEEEEEGEYSSEKDTNSLGNKRKYITRNATLRIVSDNRGIQQLTSSEYYNKHNKPTPKNIHGTTKSSDIKMISLFSAIASNDHKIKLSAIKSLPPVSLFNKEILKIIQSEITKTSSSIDFRLAALELLNEMVLLEQVNVTAIPEVTVMLLKLSYAEEVEGIKFKALTTLGTLLETKSVDWLKVRNLIKFAVPKGSKIEDPFDIFSVLPRDFKPLETIFAVLSYVAANDIHRNVRLIAMELLGKIPGAFIHIPFLYQSARKDRQKEGAGLSKIMKKKLGSKIKDGKMSLPLLCCGVFAHGIEDQFVKIRFAALNSLFALLAGSRNNLFIIKSVLCVFLDALLDECDLIRLAALKFIGQLGSLDLTVQSGLESLLAVLDDQNGEIRKEALKIIGNSLILSETGDPNSSRSATISETILRTQRCIEAAILKYPEMEFDVMEAMINFMYRVKEVVQRSCNDLLCHFMQSPVPKYMLPSSLLPTYVYGSLSNVHLIMQIPFMEDEKVKQARLVKIVSRMTSVDDGKKLKFLRSIKHLNAVGGAKKHYEPLQSNGGGGGQVFKNDQVKLFKLLVTGHGNLESKYEAEKEEEKRAFFFLNESTNPPKPVAYFRINSHKIDEYRNRIMIEDYKLMGRVDEVKIALLTAEALVPFEFKYGDTFVAPINKITSFKIINLSNDEIIYETK
jgi:hypothetical protein